MSFLAFNEMLPKTNVKKQILTFLFIMMMSVGCSLPEDPVQCSSQNNKCTISNSYGAFPDRSICHAAQIVYPTTEDEVILYVGNATKMAKKMKVSTRFSHSIPKLVCPEGGDGLLISTNNLNKILNIDKSKMEITVEPGVTLRQLIEEAAKAGLALPYTPYWWGLTIGGLLSTGAHGSTLWNKGSAVHDYVTRLRIVTPTSPKEGYAKARTLAEGHPDLNAAKVSLGVLGVISEVTLKLQPLFKRAITYVEKSDIDLGDEAVTFGIQHEFADMTWYPSQRKVVYRIDDRVSTTTPGNGVCDYLGFRPQAPPLVATQRTTEEVQEFKGDDVAKCASAKITTLTLKASAFGLTNNGLLFTRYPVVGLNNDLQSSGSCLDSLAGLTTCPWDPRVGGLFYHQTTFSITLSKVKSFIQDVQNLVTLIPSSMCNVEMYNGILMRYVTTSNAYLGKQEDSLEFDMTYYRSRDPMSPRLHEDVLEEVEQIGLFKYGGLPHWGKNRNLAFEGSINKYKHANEFLEVKKQYDPLGLFSSEWTDQILGLRNGIMVYKNGCALEGLCICSQDSHCAPSQGYVCRHGKVYKDARVCQKIV
ncbi:hypothetical protein Leryth_007681 [Lithospermum erythrorhizon]|nr:hypothetical protein Leryth_007681 [Lithospermum erythrorhizon]